MEAHSTDRVSLDYMSTVTHTIAVLCKRLDIFGEKQDKSDVRIHLLEKLVEKLMENQPPRGPCGFKFHAANCDCEGVGGDQ